MKSCHKGCPPSGPCQVERRESRRPVPLHRKPRTPIKKSETKIAPVGKKLARALTLYAKMRVPYLKENPVCGRCGGRATEVHHKQGRGPNLLKVETWLPVCRPCHHHIETHPSEAREQGWSGSRLNRKEGDI